MFKKILFVLVVACILVLPSFARAEEIRSFEVTAKIQEDASVQVSEKIEYDFGQEVKHGIFRNIPYKYKSKIGNYKLRLEDFSVTDEHGIALKFTNTYNSLDVIIKIGERDKTVTGIQTYVINYTVKNAINYFQNEDEFYWNTTGNGWSVPIKSASAAIFLPEKIDQSKIHFFCYAGVMGSTDSCKNSKSGNPILFSQDNLSIGSGITVAISFPKGAVHEPTVWEKRLAFLFGNIVVLLPLVALGIMLYLWNRYGKDPSGQSVIVAQFDAPDNLTPAEVGLLIDERANNKDISAEIINLAVKGYLKISRIEKESLVVKKSDYEFEQLKSAKDLETDHEKSIMAALFGANPEVIKPEKVLLSSLQNSSSAYEEMQKTSRLISSGLIAKGYFTSKPSTVRALYFFAGLALMMVGFFTIGLFLSPLLAATSYFITGLIVMIFSRWMPARTGKGVFARDHILGLKNYLHVAEADRIKFHNAPEKNPQIFEKLLPYAMVLGVEKDWAKQFESMYTSPPNWYHDAAGRQFSALALTNDFTNFRSSLYYSLVSHNSSAANRSNSASFGGRGSGGGGFSGGGFGGGGGGSW